MNKAKEPRKRFQKPAWNGVEGAEPSLSALGDVFCAFHLRDIRRGLYHWQRLALSNDQSAYDEGPSREDLLDFIPQLLRLTEAFSLLHQKQRRAAANGALQGLSKATQNRLAKSHRPRLLSKSERADPPSVLCSFCHTFTEAYVRSELLDLLESVITYSGPQKVYRGNGVLLYRHLLCLVRLAFHTTRPNTP